MICMDLIIGKNYGRQSNLLKGMGMSDEEINRLLKRSETKKESEGMTREDCEHRIAEKLKEIKKIVEEYAPGDNYLTMCIQDKSIDFNNSYWNHNSPNILNYYENTDTGLHNHFNMEE